MANNGKEFDTTRLDQRQHDNELFEETMEMIERFGDKEMSASRRNVVISSQNPQEVTCDYFKDAKFSRG